MSGFQDQIKKRGYFQSGIFDVLSLMVVNLAGMLTKLDADGTVNDTDYNSSLAVTSPSIGGAGSDIHKNGMPQGKKNLLCHNLRANFNLLCEKLANDSGVNGTTVYVNLEFSNTTDLINVSGARVRQTGEHQADFVQFLDDYITKFNNLLITLDGDTGVGDTDYNALWSIGDTVELPSSSSSCRSSSSSCSSSCCSSSSSSRSSSSSSSSSCRSSSSSCSSSSSSCRSSSSSCSSSSSISSSSSCRSSSSSSSSSKSSSSCSSSSCSSCSSCSSSSSCRSSSSSSSSSQIVA